MAGQKRLTLNRTGDSLSPVRPSLVLALLLIAAPVAGAEPPHRVLVSTHDSGDLAVLAAPTLDPVKTLPIGKGARGIAVAPDGKRAFVAADRMVVAVDLEKLAATRAWAIDGAGTGVAVAPDGRTVFVASERAGGGAVHVLDLKRGLVVQSIAVGERPFQVSTSPDGRFVFAVNHDSFSVSVIDASSRAKIRDIRVSPLGPGAFDKPHYLAVAPDGQRLFLPFQGRALVTVNPATGSVETAPLRIDAHQHGIAISRDGSRLFTVNNESGQGSLSILEVGTFRELRRIPVGSAHEQVALSPGESVAYLTGGFLLGGGSDELTVVDLAGGQVARRIPTGRRPLGVAVAPASGG